MTKEIEGFVRMKGSRDWVATPEMAEAVWQSWKDSPNVLLAIKSLARARIYRRSAALATSEAMKRQGYYPRPLPDGLPF